MHWNGTGTWLGPGMFSSSAKCFSRPLERTRKKHLADEKKQADEKKTGQRLSQAFPCICLHLRAGEEKQADEENMLFLFLANVFPWVRADESGAEPRTPTYKSDSRALSKN